MGGLAADWVDSAGPRWVTSCMQPNLRCGPLYFVMSRTVSRERYENIIVSQKLCGIVACAMCCAGQITKTPECWLSGSRPVTESLLAEFTACFGKGADFLARDVEGDVSKATFTREQKSFRRKIFERRLQTLVDDFGSLDQVTTLVNDPEREISSKVPQSP